MQQLTHLDVPEIQRSIQIMDEIGTKYDTLGTFLLNDIKGNKIEKIKNDFKRTNQIVREIMYQWINLSKANSWEDLVKCLKISQLIVLAENIEAVLEHCAKKNIDQECHRDSFHSVSTAPWNVVMIVTSVLLPLVLGVVVFFQCKCVNTVCLYT